MAQFRVVKIDMNTPFELGEDEQVLDKRPDYAEQAWCLLVVKGKAPPGEEKPAPFGDRAALPIEDARVLANAVSKAAAAFAAALGEPARGTSGEMC